MNWKLLSLAVASNLPFAVISERYGMTLLPYLVIAAVNIIAIQLAYGIGRRTGVNDGMLHLLTLGLRTMAPKPRKPVITVEEDSHQ